MRSRSISRFFLLSLLVCLAVLSVPAMAEDVVKTEKKPVPERSFADVPPLKEFQERTKADIQYIGSKFGLDMWMALLGPELQILYTTADKQAMLLNGMLYSAGGKDEGAVIQRDFIINNPEKAEKILESVGTMREASLRGEKMKAPDPAIAIAQMEKEGTPPTRGDMLWTDLATSRYIAFGPVSNKIIYMFTDPACEHCHHLWQKLEPLLRDNNMQLRLVPVAILGKKSEKLVAQLLSQEDKESAWKDIIANKPLKARADVTGVGGQSLNNSLLKNYKITSTPLLVYRNGENGKVRLMVGNPVDLKPFLTDLGVPATTTAAPASDAQAEPAATTEGPQETKPAATPATTDKND